MKILKGLLPRSSEATDLVKFLWKAKLWFLIPFILVLLILGFLIIVVQSSGVAPFVYTLF